MVWPVEAVEAVFAAAWVQCCVVHLIRNSLKHVSYRDRKEITRDLRPIYRAATEDDALEALLAFDDKWGARYPMIGEMWRRHWERFIPFFAFPDEIVASCTRRTRSRRSTGSCARSSRPIRHSYVTALLAAGVPVKVVNQRVGHASPMITLSIYQRVMPGDDRSAADIGARVILGDSDLQAGTPATGLQDGCTDAVGDVAPTQLVMTTRTMRSVDWLLRKSEWARGT